MEPWKGNEPITFWFGLFLLPLELLSTEYYWVANSLRHLPHGECNVIQLNSCKRQSGVRRKHFIQLREVFSVVFSWCLDATVAAVASTQESLAAAIIYKLAVAFSPSVYVKGSLRLFRSTVTWSSKKKHFRSELFTRSERDFPVELSAISRIARVNILSHMLHEKPVHMYFVQSAAGSLGGLPTKLLIQQPVWGIDWRRLCSITDQASRLVLHLLIALLSSCRRWPQLRCFAYVKKTIVLLYSSSTILDISSANLGLVDSNKNDLLI